MAGLDQVKPGHLRPRTRRQPAGCIMSGAWIYIMINRRDGTLYVGVTSNLAQRVWQHKEGVVEGFTKRYNLRRLVYVEHHETSAARSNARRI
jgi:predicted GIY-YIG superfamily endonuclease